MFIIFPVTGVQWTYPRSSIDTWLTWLKGWAMLTVTQD
jgi:hypothetical protein